MVTDVTPTFLMASNDLIIGEILSFRLGEKTQRR